MTKEERSLAEKVRKTFNRDNISVDLIGNKLLVTFGVTQRPPAFGSVWTEWVPFGGGPLYGEHAMSACRWLAAHIEEYRDLLPARVRQFDVSICKT